MKRTIILTFAILATSAAYAQQAAKPKLGASKSDGPGRSIANDQQRIEADKFKMRQDKQSKNSRKYKKDARQMQRDQEQLNRDTTR